MAPEAPYLQATFDPRPIGLDSLVGSHIFDIVLVR